MYKDMTTLQDKRSCWEVQYSIEFSDVYLHRYNDGMVVGNWQTGKPPNKAMQPTPTASADSEESARK